MSVKIPGGHSRYVIDDSDQTYVLAAGVEHRTQGDVPTIVMTEGSQNDTLIIKGKLDQVGNQFPANWIINAAGPNTTLDVTSTGSILGNGGVYFSGANATIDNTGTISARDSEQFKDAVTTWGANASISNTGTIQSQYGTDILVAAAEGGDINNNGVLRGFNGIVVNSASNTTVELGGDSRIFASSVGIEVVYSDNVSLINHGLIDSKSYAIYCGDNENTVVNSGVIRGSVFLGGGNDVFEAIGGSINKAISGGLGDDTLITDNGAVQLKESSEQGFDTVKSSASYTLSENVERLILTGKADIDGTGTDGNDILIGNRGDNNLSGKFRSDTLSGGKGNDMLTGGFHDDTFVFKTGFDHDTITDFDKHGEHDKIDLSGWIGITSFDDVKQHWAMDHGNLVITIGNDELILADTTKADVHDTDFIFAP